MYKLLVVDDEKVIRKGILLKLQNLGFGFDRVEEASNGEEALDKMRKECPDIVITDVRMPFMDGIQFISCAREEFPHTRFIIISGYAEFEYAEQALNMGVQGYLLKPITDENMKQTMKKVLHHLGRDQETRLNEKKKEVLEEGNRRLVLEMAVNQALNMSKDAGAVLFNQGCTLPWPESYKKFVLLLFHIDSSNFYTSQFKYQDMELVKFAVRNILDEISEREKMLVFNNLKDVTQVFVLAAGEQEGALKKLSNSFAFDALAKIAKYLEISVTVAISDVNIGISSDLLKQAQAAFDLRLVNGTNKIYKYVDMNMGQNMVPPENSLRILQKCIEMYDFQNIHQILADLFSPGKLKDKPGAYIKLVYSEVVVMIIKICSCFGIDMEKALDPGFISGEALNRFDSADNVVSYIYTTILDVLKGETTPVRDSRDIIEKARTYILHNYAKELSVKDMAQKFALNAAYFSNIFKQITGKTITKYIMDLRIERACQLLRETDIGIAEIAEGVGYEDTQYFYRVFKKVTDMTPLEYRNRYFNI